MVCIGPGSFQMGSEDRGAIRSDGEGPVRSVSVDAFWIDRTAVSNTEFRAFVEATGYSTDAEIIGWSFVFAGLLPDDFESTRGVAHAPWWRQVHGASWDHPAGPQSNLDALGDHPAVHISWRDATSYAEWMGKRLPSEAEWEYAARGGLEQKTYPWGDELTPDGEHRCNIWQGIFPSDNHACDGFYATAPVDHYAPNGHGLYNTTGNVWEWCADWFSTTFHGVGAQRNPKGPATGSHRVIKGGSYLCHASYCFRYRVSARSASTIDTSIGHTGFRCAKDLD
ncbi:MAG: formylglycine-generating enzyme family protein [Myxococcota bacterium]